MRAWQPRQDRRGGGFGGALRLFCLVVVVMAPVAGDIGSCGQATGELDPVKFFWQKQGIDCQQCQRCEFVTQSCSRACETPYDPEASFDPDCFPLVHDGEVCLDALQASDCDAYAAYMSDLAPTAPTECNFCPLNLKPALKPDLKTEPTP
jgi:hypothetical protein